ncbi:MAG: hypothetical protein GF320_05655 [Armatimonadia bacterium]|nr:hypothetical protein [Armatimonadia bacterium]
MSFRPAGLAMVAALAAVLGCATGPTPPPTWQLVSPGTTTTVTGPGGSLVFGPSSVDQPVRVTMSEASPQGIELGEGCGLSNPVVLGALRFEVEGDASIRDVRGVAEIPPTSAGSFVHVYREALAGGGYTDAGDFAVVASGGSTAVYEGIDREGTWAFVVPGGG